MSQSVYELVTARITEALSRGVVPWRKPWNDTASIPRNAVSKRPYSGINLFLLGLSTFRDPRFLTFDQARQLGGTVRKGERSSVAVFWKQWSVERIDQEAQEKKRGTIPLLRYYHLFNVEQVDGLKLPPLPIEPAKPDVQRIEVAESLVRNMMDPPRILERGNAAWYRPSDDTVSVPPIEAFISSDHFYATLFHELAHSTGHMKRLSRPGVTETVQFGSNDYSREELVAEFAAAFLAVSIGLDNSLYNDAASYIEGWRAKLHADPKALVAASAQGQRAADYIRSGVVTPSEQLAQGVG